MLILKEIFLGSFTWRRCTYAYFSGATLRISYLLCLEADIAGNRVRPTFEK